MRKNNKKQLIICLISMLLVLLKMKFNNDLFLFLVLLIVSVAILLEKKENKSLYLVFMLPLIYVLKFHNTGMTVFNVFTLVYLFSVILEHIKTRQKIQKKPLFFLLLLVAFITFIGALNNSFDFNSFIGWVLGFFVLYFMMEHIQDMESYKSHLKFFALSLSITGIIGILCINSTGIGTYLSNMRRTNTILSNGVINYRYSGFDLDPNYFALQSLIAFFPLFVTKDKNEKSSYLLLITLLIVGITTISKMYLFTLIIGLLLYLFLNRKKLISKKMIVSIVISGIAIFFFYQYLYPIFAERLGGVTNLSGLTTGRSDIWKMYLSYIFDHPKTLIFGQGVGTSYLYGHASHSTYILLIYRFGMIGTTLLFAFFKSLIRNVKIKLLMAKSLPLLILCITNFALDIIDFDSFVYMMFFVLAIYKVKGGSYYEKNS